MHLNQQSNSGPQIWRPTFLLHCNGANGSTTFTDSIGGLTVTANGNAQIDTAQSKFGGASAKFDGSGDWLQIAANAALDVTDGAFTVECWARVSSSASGNGIILNKGIGTGTYTIEFWYEHSSGKLGIRGFYADSSSWGWQTAAAVTKDQWYHMALTRHGRLLQAFVDGVLLGSSTYTTVNTLFTSASALTIGAFDNGVAPLLGWVDEVRIIKGRAMYLQAFTPPTAEFTDHA